MLFAQKFSINRKESGRLVLMIIDFVTEIMMAIFLVNICSW